MLIESKGLNAPPLRNGRFRICRKARVNANGHLNSHFDSVPRQRKEPPSLCSSGNVCRDVWDEFSLPGPGARI